MQSTLDRLHQWSCEWQLTINHTKSNILHLGKTNYHHPYFINGCQLSQAQVVTDLGVDIDNYLTYNAHVNKIVGKAYSRIGLLFKDFASRDAQILKQAYITYIRPVLEYASSVWSPYLLKHINAIERVQKQFTRRIPSLSALSYPERLAAMDLEPLELRRLKTDLILYYKCINNLVALPSDDYFCLSQRISQTRSGGNRIIRTSCNTNHFQNDFFNRCLSCWNYLPNEVVNASSLPCFKRLIANVDLSPFIHCSYL